MKKTISAKLVICMIFGLFLPAIAADISSESIYVGSERTVISSSSYISYEGVGSFEPIYKTNSFTYQLNFLNSGYYRLSIRNLNFNDTTEATIARISVDGKEMGFGIIPKEAIPGETNSTQESYICSFCVEAGQKSLTVYNDGAPFYFYDVILEKVEIREEYTISANDYTNISDTGITDTKPDTGMSPEAYAEYDFTADCDGTYGVYVTVAANPGTEGTVRAILDDVSVGEGIFAGRDWYEFEEVYIGSVSLKEGSYVLRITAGAVMRLQNIRIKAVVKATEEAFLSEFQDADSVLSLQTLFKDYNDSMIIPYDSYMNKIFYRRIVEEELLKVSCDSLIEFDSLFLTIYNEEKRNPLVTVTQNGESVTELKAGDFTVTIAPRFMEELIAIAFMLFGSFIAQILLKIIVMGIGYTIILFARDPFRLYMQDVIFKNTQKEQHQTLIAMLGLGVKLTTAGTGLIFSAILINYPMIVVIALMLAISTIDIVLSIKLYKMVLSKKMQSPALD